MPRFRSALAGFALIVACRALPSASPLADTGEGRAFDDGALSRNRVPLASHKAGGADTDDDLSPADDVVTIVAPGADAGDAGAPEAGVESADAGVAGSKWAGEYFGSDRHTRSATGVPDSVELDDKARTRVEEPSPGVLVISLVSSGDGQVICALKAHAKGDKAELDDGASCPGLMLMPPLDVTGSAELDGERLEVDLEGHGEFPGEDRTMEMDVEYHFEGKRR